MIFTILFVASMHFYSKRSWIVGSACLLVALAVLV